MKLFVNGAVGYKVLLNGTIEATGFTLTEPLKNDKVLFDGVAGWSSGDIWSIDTATDGSLVLSAPVLVTIIHSNTKTLDSLGNSFLVEGDESLDTVCAFVSGGSTVPGTIKLVLETAGQDKVEGN